MLGIIVYKENINSPGNNFEFVEFRMTNLQIIKLILH